jgi:hypothetical protein
MSGKVTGEVARDEHPVVQNAGVWRPWSPQDERPDAGPVGDAVRDQQTRDNEGADDYVHPGANPPAIGTRYRAPGVP